MKDWPDHPLEHEKLPQKSPLAQECTPMASNLILIFPNAPMLGTTRVFLDLLLLTPSRVQKNNNTTKNTIL